MQNSINSGGNKRQLRFRGDVSGASSRVEELQHHQEENRQQKPKQQPLSQDDVAAATAATSAAQQRLQSPTETGANTFLDFFKVEMTRGYMLEHDEERYSARRQKIYSFMRIPRDLERFMIYGIMQCADSFFYIHTFLPVRFLLAVWALVTRTVARICRLRSSGQRLLSPAEICDLLKGAIWITVTLLMLLVDTNRVYHIIKSQSIIKLYIFYNMLEVGDRLLSAFGQDTIDALFWTATEPKNSKREHFGAFTHVILTLTYVFLHSGLIMFQATCLNVALNSNNKGLLTIMISNNFVELKGSVFKKFDKNNLFQLTCSDVRERFHLSILLFIVIIQTMKEFDWSFTQFYVMVPDCIAVLFTEILIDWVKHAFITRFNELPESIYREYTTSLAYDMTQTRQKHAFSDHSDLVARRMGFIPFPLSVVLIKAIYTAVSFHNLAAWLLFLLAYLFALGLRICLTICALGKACKLMKEHQTERNSSTPSSMTNMPFVGAEQQKALEQQIQWELLQRNLEVETETETESLSRSVSAEREEMDYREEVMAMPPPAPVAFKDNSKERQNVRKRSRRREAPMTTELVNYMELSKTMELRRKPSGNSSKRSLYTKGDSFREDDDSVSPEKQPKLSQTRPGSTLGRARSKESHDVVEEDIFIVPPPPRSLRYSQCVRDLNRLRATPQDSTDEDTPLCHLKGQNNNLNEIASPPPEFNDNNDNEMDGADCSSSGQAQHRLSKSPLPPVERSEFDDQSVQKANKNRRSRQSRHHKSNPPSPEKNKTTDTHREDLAIVSSSVPGTTSMTDDQPSTSRAALDALARRAIEPDPDPEPDPEPEPEPEAEPEPVLEEEAVVFKKPKARAPRTKSRANRELENLKHSFMHDDVEVDSNETGNRRSKRGQVPLKNTWCHTMDPMKFDFFRKSVETYDRIKAKPKPSSKQSSMSKLSKMSLLKRPPLCSSTPRISEEPLNAVTETIEPPEPSDCSSLGIAPLRWEDNEQIEQVESSDARKQTKKRGRTKKKRQESAAAASMPLTPVMETETETDPQPDSVPDPITPINAPTPSPSISDEHQASYMQLMSWLRGHSSNQPSSNMEDSTGSGVGNTVSVASELLFTNLDDIEYAFYETKERATLGYMRFQPLQSRRKKRARSFSLKFVVLFGKFALDCTVPDVAEDDHRILNIGDMAEIEKGTRFGFSNLLNEVSVLMVIRH